jgi:lipopolysaccharide/colanic/teichoic acid biosynthesis glycosyltransferase
MERYFASEISLYAQRCRGAQGCAGAAANDPRVTRIAGFIRRCRIDELPQLVNILRGDMSFVGPRPERPIFVDDLRQRISYYDERHSVRPGLTGRAQVSYSYGASVEDAFRKLEYDLFYLKNLTILFDCSIILRTCGIVLMGQAPNPLRWAGIVQESVPFTGLLRWQRMQSPQILAMLRPIYDRPD